MEARRKRKWKLSGLQSGILWMLIDIGDAEVPVILATRELKGELGDPLRGAEGVLDGLWMALRGLLRAEMVKVSWVGPPWDAEEALRMAVQGMRWCGDHWETSGSQSGNLALIPTLKAYQNWGMEADYRGGT